LFETKYYADKKTAEKAWRKMAYASESLIAFIQSNAANYILISAI